MFLYVGPGMGMTTALIITIVLGIVVLSIFIVAFRIIKRLFSKKTEDQNPSVEDNENAISEKENNIEPQNNSKQELE